jgi:hypothetical protein
MGHSERFYLGDLREGEYGIEHSRLSRDEIQQEAISKRYSGPIQVRVTAYPPKPSAELLVERAMREQSGYADDEISV